MNTWSILAIIERGWMNGTYLILATPIHFEKVICVNWKDARKLDTCAAYSLVNVLLDMYLGFIISAKSKRLDLVNDGTEVAV